MEDDLKELSSGNGYQNDLLLTVSDRIKKTVLVLRQLDNTFNTQSFMTQTSIRDLSETLKIENNKTRRSITELTRTIKLLDSKNGKLQEAILFLTIVTVITGIIQVATAIYSINH